MLKEDGDVDVESEAKVEGIHLSGVCVCHRGFVAGDSSLALCMFLIQLLLSR